MKRRVHFRRFAPAFVAFLVVQAATAFAKDTRRVKVVYPASVGGTTLTAGEYKLQSNTKGSDATINFVKGKSVVATAHGQWVNRDAEYDQDAVIYDKASDGSRSIIEMRFAGSKRALVVSGSTAEANSAGPTPTPATESAPATPAAKPGSAGDGNPQVRFLGKPRRSGTLPADSDPGSEGNLFQFQSHFKSPVNPVAPGQPGLRPN